MSKYHALGILRPSIYLASESVDDCSVDDCESIEQPGITDVECDCEDEEEAGMT